MTTSVFMTNLAWVLLLANWAAEWNWREKLTYLRNSKLLQAVLLFMGVHLLWLVGTADLAYGLHDIQKKLPLLAIPLVVLTTAPPSQKERLNIGIAYVGAIFVVTLIGWVRHLTIPDLPYRDIVPYISHIRFGLNICLALVLLAYAAVRERRRWLYAANALLALWLLAFLLLIRAYTAFIILLVLAIVLPLCCRRKMSPRLFRIALGGGLALLLAAATVTGLLCYDYYHLKPLSTQPLASCTANGTPYLHRDDGLIENGNYVHHYVCEPELRQQWALVSDVPFDSLTPVGYTIYPALLRYLNGMGLTKDSAGMTQLTADDIAAIEKGIANPVYTRPGLRKMVYVLCYEYENYRCYRSVNNFTMLQRFELWRAGGRLFLRHPLLGVGTGDVPDELHHQLQADQSPLADTQLHTHSQYLNLLLAFGLLGFGLIVAAFWRAAHHLHRKAHRGSPALFAAFLCILLISFISEDTLETLAGITFAVMGLSLLAPRPSTPTYRIPCTNTTPSPTDSASSSDIATRQ